MTKSELKQKLATIVLKQRATIKILGPHKDNPQVQTQIHCLNATNTAFQAVLDSLRDNDVLLNTYI